MIEKFGPFLFESTFQDSMKVPKFLWKQMRERVLKIIGYHKKSSPISPISQSTHKIFLRSDKIFFVVVKIVYLQSTSSIPLLVRQFNVFIIYRKDPEYTYNREEYRQSKLNKKDEL